MPKSYEDEIRDLLKGMDRFPGEGGRPRRRWGGPSLGRFGFGSLGRVDARRVMGGALILMLFAWILRGPWGGGFPWLLEMAGYISLAALVLFVAALIMLIRAGGAFGPTYPPQMWRGRVIKMPRRGGLFSAWRRWFRRGPLPFARGRQRPRGRDSFQW